jgi:hypothetical protein
MIYWVYKILWQTEEWFELELVKNALTAYPNQLENLQWLVQNNSINILNLNELRKWKITYLRRWEWIDNIENLVLLSSWVVEYITWSTWKQHIITTLRDWGAADELQRTTVAWRNEWEDLILEMERELYEESPFLVMNEIWEYALTIAEWNEKWKDYTKDSIRNWLKEKYNLDRNKEEQAKFIKMFERSFPWIKYEDLGKILGDIIENDRFVTYSWREWEIKWTQENIKKIKLWNSKWNFYVFFDEANNTIEYRWIREITALPKWYKTIWNRPTRLYLESQNQAPRLKRLWNDVKNSVPTIKMISAQVRKALDKKSL